MKILRGAGWVVLLALAAGCATPAARIRRDPELFASFPPAVQAQVRQGRIALGFSPDAVRMALGEPDRIYHRATTNGVNEVWAYTAYDYRGPPQYATVFAPPAEPWPGNYTTGVVLLEVHQPNAYETLRVEFEGGRVKAIEALKH